MLHNPARTPTQYAQSFGTPGNVNIAMNGAQGVPFGSQAQTQRGRPRTTSNINMQAPEGYQGRDPNISQWQSGVLASQAGSAQPPQVVDQRMYGGHGGAPAAFADVPNDPGPRPNFDGLTLKAKDKKFVMDHWQKKKDKFDEYYATKTQPTQKRSRSQGRYQEQNTATFPSGYNSNPASDVERAMNRLSLNPNSTAAAQRQAERGRRLSGGALGLSGSAAQREAAQAAQAAQQQQEQMRMFRERSRSRQPFDRNDGADIGGRPAYMPSGGGNIGADPLLGNGAQPGVIPRAYAGTSTQPQVTRVTNMGQYSQGGVSPIVNPYSLQQQSPQQPQASPAMYGQQPQVSPAHYGQQLPQMVNPNDQPQMVPMQTMGGVMTMAVPIGHVSQYPALFTQMQPGVSPQPSPLDGSGMAPFLTPSMYAQQISPDQTGPPRRRHNITEVTGPNSNQYQPPLGSAYVTPNPKTFLNPGAPPPKHHTVNINSYTVKEASTQPEVRPRAHSQSGYVVSAAPSQPPSVGSTNSYSGAPSSGSSGERSYATMNSYQSNQRPPPVHNESVTGLSQTTGPAGFGSRPSHARQPSYQAALRDPSQTSSPSDAGSGRGEKVPVSMRRPNSRMQIHNFPTTIISYDLNSEHRQQTPIRFGRFVYDRDVTHEEWSVFTSQILDVWKERDPGFNRYHSAVRRINAILSAWNYAFFNPRGMDIVLFKGNERRSGARFGQPEPNLDFLEEAGHVSEEESSNDEDDEDDEENPAHFLQQQDPDYRLRIEREKAAIKAYRREEKRREATSKPLEAPHSLVVYELPMPGESYR